MSSIGIMDPAFFVGKGVLLKWLNDSFDAGYTKVEQCASGALYCQILDCLYPGKVPLHKVNFDAKFDYEFVQNWKILQVLFDKEQISKHVDVVKLVKAKYQDNLEFLQWMKNFFDTQFQGQEYNARERRDNAKSQYKKGHKHAGTGKSEAAPTSAAPAAASKPAAEPKPKPAVASTSAAKPVTKKPASTGPPSSSSGTSSSRGKAAAKSADSDAESSLNGQLSQLRLTVEGLEKERNFYFGKLREIEILCQGVDEVDSTKSPFCSNILKILYQTDDSDEFQAPDQASTNTSVVDSADVEPEPVSTVSAATESGLLDDEF